MFFSMFIILGDKVNDIDTLGEINEIKLTDYSKTSG